MKRVIKKITDKLLNTIYKLLSLSYEMDKLAYDWFKVSKKK